MDWNPIHWFTKENPAQDIISREAGHNVGSDMLVNYRDSYKEFECVRRGVDMIVNGASLFDVDILDGKVSEGIPNLRKNKLISLLNHKPNPYQDIQKFRNLIFLDYIIEGNIFLYWDGAYIYHLPAANVQIVPDDVTYVSMYKYNNRTEFAPGEIIHVQDHGVESIYRGTSRLSSANRSLNTLKKMRMFQDAFFENGCAPSLVLETDNTLSAVAKERTLSQWTLRYNTKKGSSGARKPMIVDSGLKVKSIFDTSFKELDFEASVASHEAVILKALGVPPILLDGGNNANISPNLRLFYLETIVPIVNKYISALEFFFGFDLQLITTNISAIQPDLKDIAAYNATLVNTGIISPDEAREELRYPVKGGQAADLRIPANIAGSAANPSEGGKPPASSSTNN